MNHIIPKKYLYLLFFGTLTSFLQASISEPGKKLLTPQEVLLKIGNFKDAIDKKREGHVGETVATINKEYVADIKKAEELLKEAYEALYICDHYTFSDFEAWISNYQSWARDPQRYTSWKENMVKENSTIDYDAYDDECLREKKILISACSECHNLRALLFRDIEDLSSFIIYRKLRADKETVEYNEEVMNMFKNQKTN